MNVAHGADLELARQCAAGNEPAWERFMLEYRPVLYRAADALDPSGGARELADALYADLYGDGPGRSLFRYFQGRSSLATWLRAVLSQRYVDRVRTERRLAPLPDEDADAGSHIELGRRAGVGGQPSDPDRRRYLALVRQGLGSAVARLTERDRLRLGLYYVQELTLAETGRLLKEHEATVSRQLARTRSAIRKDVEHQLRDVAGLTSDQIAECFMYAAEDPGPIDLKKILSAAGERKEPVPERS